MSKLLPALVGLTCLTWIFAWTYQLSGPALSANQPGGACGLTYVLTDEKFKLSTQDLFSFGFSEEQPMLTDSTLSFLRNLAEYLAANPSKRIYLTGLYAPGETNRSISANLGVARAEAVKSILVQKGASPDNILSADFRTNSLHWAAGKILDGVFFSFGEAQPLARLSAGPGSADYPSSSSGGGRIFYFPEGSHSLSEKDKQTLKDLRDYLKTDATLRVRLTGYAQEREEQDAGKNLAELRAQSVRRYLVDSGLRKEKIEIATGSPRETGNAARIVTVTIQQLSNN